MNAFLFIFLIAAAGVALRGALIRHNFQELDRLRNEEIGRYLAAVERDPKNASAHAFLGEKYLEDGLVGRSIQEYRTAIGLSPQGPFATKWKRQLKEALRMQEYLEAGQPVPGFHSFQVCDHCHVDVDAAAKKCPHCGTELQVGVVEWTLRPENRNDIIKNTVILAGSLVVGAILFSFLPIEIKGVLMVATIAVAYWLFLRSFGV